MKNNPRIDKDDKRICPRCNNRKWWTARGNVGIYARKCTKCGYRELR